ncbi:MAG TPA: methyl-accepting chemotaxis protein [Opitutaceae bacterium]
MQPLPRFLPAASPSFGAIRSRSPIAARLSALFTLTALPMLAAGAAASSSAAAHAPPPTDASGPQLLRWIAGSAVGGLVVLAAQWWIGRRWLHHWTIGRRIALGFGTVLGGLGLIGVFATEAIQNNYHRFREYRTAARQSNLVGRAQANFLEMRVVAKAYFVDHSAEEATAFTERDAKLRGFLAQAKAALTHPERLKTVESIEAELGRYASIFGEIVALGSSGGAASEALVERMVQSGTVIDGAVEELTLAFVADQDRIGPRIQNGMAETRIAIISLALSAFVIAVAFAWQISRGLSATLRATAADLAHSAQQLASASSQVSAASQTLASGASEQAAAVEETGSSLEELSAMTKRNADAAHETRTLAGDTRAAAEAGARNMAEMQQAMGAIKESSSNIARIVKTIDEIAFQTNILALNAAVEAARAGDAGAGFAVVADEVRALAQRSAQSARETSAMIEEAVSRSDRGADISTKVSGALDEILSKARQVDGLVGEIARASQEQAQGLGQINTAVAQIDTLTQTNAASSEESAAAAEELLAQAATMRTAVTTLERLVGIARSGDVATSLPEGAAPPPATSSSVPPTRKAARFAMRLAPPHSAHAPAIAASGQHGFFSNGNARNGHGPDGRLG